MRRLALVVVLLAGCACDHAIDARLIRRGVELVADAAGVAAVRSLTPAEAAQLERGVRQVEEHAAALEADTE